MPHHLPSLLVAAAVSTAAAFGVAGIAGSTEPAADAAGAAGAVAGAPAVASTLPDPATLVAPRQEREALAPRTVAVPQRDLAAVAPAPPPEPEPTSDDGQRPVPRRLSGTGELLAAAGTSSDPLGDGGRTVRFSVEVEDGTGLDPDAVADVVEEALYDGRSWARTFELRRVAPRDASLHVVIAAPASVDRICARAGLNTAGWLSCWSGTVAAINIDRWTQGVGHIEDLDLYRRYVVNHEVGHGLGFGHVGCTGRGLLAPVMQQQTKSLDGCVANDWPFPDA